MEIYRTNNLVEVVKKSRIPGSFLRTRFFPTTPRDIFKTKEVFIERTDEGNLCAPFVIPYSGAKLMERQGYTGEKLIPAFINPARDMSISQLEKKGIGETLYDEVTPEERAQNYLADDLVFLQKAIQRTQEWMCGQILVNGYVDCAIDANTHVRFKYYDQNFDNRMTFTSGGSTVYWDSQGASIYEQLSTMVNDIDAEYGDIDIVLGAELVNVFLTDQQMLKMLDVANANFGRIDPALQQFPGVGLLGAINFGGKLCYVWTYNAKATIGSQETSFIDGKYALAIPRTGFGATKFGSITQMEQEDNDYHTYAAEMVPRVLNDPHSDNRRIEMKSAPLPHPYALDSWRVTKALA